MLANLLFPGRDVGFGTLIDRLSEPESGPHADNFVTNEDSFPRACGDLDRLAPEGGVYLGVGPDQNLTYLAHCRPALAFVIDYRRRNLLLHLLHKALFALADDRASYLERLTARAPAEPVGDNATADDLIESFQPAEFDRDRLDRATADVAEYLRPFKVVRDDEWDELATIQARLAGPGLEARFLALPIYPTLADLMRTPDREGRPAHLLAREAFYRGVRDLERGDGVIPIVGNLGGSVAMPRLAAFLRDRAMAISVVYASDAEFFLLRDGEAFDAYIANLDRLPRAEGAILVRTSTRPIDHPERVDGDSSTTIVRLLGRFLDDARAGRIRTPDDLFRG